MQNYYAPPTAAGAPGAPGPGGYYGPQPGGAWREGDQLVVVKGTALPDRCVRCNAPAEGYKLTRMLYWNPPWVYVTLLLGLLIFVIVALVTRKSGIVHIGLCPEHRARRRNLLIAAGVSPLLTLGGCAASISAESGIGAFVFLMLTLIVPFGLVIVATPLRVKLIDDQLLRLRVGDQFLASFDVQPGG